MATDVRHAFGESIELLALDRILPTRKVDKPTKKTAKYRCIAASIRELGIIEPLCIYPQPGTSGLYTLLDGHVRLEILKDLGETQCKCLISTDDEGYTYNHKLNRLTAIQEHFMILRAINNGVTEEKIALTLDVDVSRIRQKRNLLDGICSEAVQILKDRGAVAGSLRELKKVKPMRQIEIAELMCAACNFSETYAKCLVIATSEEQLIDPEKVRGSTGMTPEEAGRMEHEMETLGREFRVIEESHGKNVLNLVLVTGYLKSVLDNVRVVRFLAQRYPELLREFQKLVAARNLSDGISAA